jgi:hypothetical protein
MALSTAEYRTLLRTMLVREDGDSLHLLSVVSPNWIGAGKTISVRQAPTYFGKIGYTLTQPAEGDAVLKLDQHFDRPPQAIVVHLPWFVDLLDATVDGKSASSRGGDLSVPPSSREIRLHWRLKSDAPSMSYAQAVDDYKAEYARRYNVLMHGGEPGK